MVRCLQKAAVARSIWRWPEKPDEEEYVPEDIHQESETLWIVTVKLKPVYS